MGINFNATNISASVLDIINAALAAAEVQRLAAIDDRKASKDATAKAAAVKVRAKAKADNIKVKDVDLSEVLTEEEAEKYREKVKAADALKSARGKTSALALRLQIRTGGDRDIKFGENLRADFDGFTFAMESGMLSGDGDRDDLTTKATEKLTRFVAEVTGRMYALYKETEDSMSVKYIKDTDREYVLAIRDGLMSTGAFILTDGVLVKKYA